MRKAVVPFVLTASLIAAAIFSGCEEIASGEVITETKDFSGFSYVDAGSAFEVEITRSDSYSVVISADESLFDYVEVSKAGATLKIYLNPHHILTDFTLGAKTLKAEITMPALHGLELSGASRGTITGFQSSHDFNLLVSGASTLEMVDIGVGNAGIEVSGASRVSGNMTAYDTRFEISGASSCELSGSADSMVGTCQRKAGYHGERCLKILFLREPDFRLHRCIRCLNHKAQIKDTISFTCH